VAGLLNPLSRHSADQLEELNGAVEGLFTRFQACRPETAVQISAKHKAPGAVDEQAIAFRQI